VFSRVLSSERLALRPMLPAPIASRSMPFEVIQSTLQRHKDSTSALLTDSDAWGLARSPSRETLAPLSPSASSQKMIVVPSPSQTWTREEYVAHQPPSRRGSGLLAAKAAEDALADGGAGAQTLIESCESYLSLLRQQQQRLREQRDEQQRLQQQPPPVAGWYAIKSPAFGANLQRARSWAEPSELDWWRAQH
jgi:predicted component of type VI protein secretion system